MGRILIVLLLLPVPGVAETQKPGVKPQTECSSCTARHKSLQRLQKARAEQNLPPTPVPRPAPPKDE